MAAQSPSLVPADGALYALRDATATVPSIPLIAASVMSKKLAVATDLILLDVKTGSGAFMKTPEHAVDLANACLRLARGAGRPGARGRHRHDPAARRCDRQRARHRRGRGAACGGSTTGGCASSRSLFVATALEVELGVGLGRGDGPGRARDRFRRGPRSIPARWWRRRAAIRAWSDDPWSVLPRAAVVKPVRQRSGGHVGHGRRRGARRRPAWRSGPGGIRKGDPIDPSVGIVMRAKIGSGTSSAGRSDRRDPRRGPGRGRPGGPPRSSPR